MCLFIITNTSPSQEWEAHHGLLEWWPFLWTQRRSLYPAMDIQWKKIIIKWRLFCWHICTGLLCCQLAAMTMMTYWQRLHGDTPSSIALLGLGQEISALGVRRGKSRRGWWRLRASWMRMDEDIWLSAARRPIWLCQKSTRERKDTRGLVSIGKCSLPHMDSSSSSSFRLEFVVFLCLSCFVMPGCLYFLEKWMFLQLSIAALAQKVLAIPLWTLVSLTNHAIFSVEVGASRSAEGATLDDWEEHVRALCETVIDFTVFLCLSLLFRAFRAAVWYPTTNTL